MMSPQRASPLCARRFELPSRPTNRLLCCEHLITVALTSAGSERLSSPQAEETDLAPTVEYIEEYFLTGEEPLWKQHDELCDWQPPSAWEESGGLQWARK